MITSFLLIQAHITLCMTQAPCLLISLIDNITPLWQPSILKNHSHQDLATLLICSLMKILQMILNQETAAIEEMEWLEQQLLDQVILYTVNVLILPLSTRHPDSINQVLSIDTNPQGNTANPQSPASTSTDRSSSKSTTRMEPPYKYSANHVEHTTTSTSNNAPSPYRSW